MLSSWASSNRVCRKRRGVATVEFAIALPLLMLLFAIAADYSRLFWYKQTVIACAHGGVSYAARADSEDPEFKSDISSVALMNAEELGGEVTIETELVANPRGKPCVEVTASYVFHPILKLPFLPNEIDISHTARMRILIHEDEDGT